MSVATTGLSGLKVPLPPTPSPIHLTKGNLFEWKQLTDQTQTCIEHKKKAQYSPTPCFGVFFVFWVFLAVLGLRCCVQAFSSCGEGGLLFVAVHGLLTAMASLVAEHGLQALGLQ